MSQLAAEWRRRSEEAAIISWWSCSARRSARISERLFFSGGLAGPSRFHSQASHHISQPGALGMLAPHCGHGVVSGEVLSVIPGVALAEGARFELAVALPPHGFSRAAP